MPLATDLVNQFSSSLVCGENNVQGLILGFVFYELRPTLCPVRGSVVGLQCSDVEYL